jgi:hypothetical protein
VVVIDGLDIGRHHLNPGLHIHQIRYCLMVLINEYKK